MSLQICFYCSDDLVELVELFIMVVYLFGRLYYDVMQFVVWVLMLFDLDEWVNCFIVVNMLIMEDIGCLFGFVLWCDDGRIGGYISYIFVCFDVVCKGIVSCLLVVVEMVFLDVGMIYVYVSLVVCFFFEKYGYVVVKEEIVVCVGFEFMCFEMCKIRVV